MRRSVACSAGLPPAWEGAWDTRGHIRIPSSVLQGEWTGQWRESILGLRPSTLARLDATVRTPVLREWGGVALSGVVNADVRAWSARLHADGLSASSVRKAVFAPGRILARAVADRRLSYNPADEVPLATEDVNLSIKQIKRVGRGFRNFDNYRLRLLLHCGGCAWQDQPAARLRGAVHG